MIRTLFVLSAALLTASASFVQAGAQAPPACIYLGYDTPGAHVEAYQAGGSASPLTYVGIRTWQHGSVFHTGRNYSHPQGYPTTLEDEARRFLLLHPGTFATVNLAAALACPVDRTGRSRLTGAFARANNNRNAGNGVYVAVFRNSDDAHPLFSGAIGSNHSVDPGNPFGGTGVLPFDVTADFAAGDIIRFAVFSNGDGTFDATALRASIDALEVAIEGPGSGAIYPVGTAVPLSGKITDLAGGSHSAVWRLVSGTQDIVVDGAVSAPTQADDPALETKHVSATYTFSQAGVYRVTLTVADQACHSASAETVGAEELTAMVVVYDPSGGYVNGGGWIVSPPGAFAADASLAGKASFGFVSKYERGATVPTGNTEFKFRAAGFDFRSTAYEWLVIAGAKAQYKGWGEVNGEGGYRFMLTGWDGQRPGGGGLDGLRLRVWSEASGAVVYDNVGGADDSSDSTTALGAGSVTIHRD